jgi:nanoRNase/pAp phosphatase (c-di-AMP/oligoRNAs hydrolase)
MTESKFRLVTRSDFDGLVCAILLRHLDLIDEIEFVHPKDMQDGKVTITSRDMTTNLPYVEGVHIAFDHHHSETLRNEIADNHVIQPNSPSAARVVWNHYGGSDIFPGRWNDMMAAVDKADSAQYSRDEILEPSGWDLLNFIMDPRTGLGRFRDFRVSNYALMMDLIEYCKDHTLDDVLVVPDVIERVSLFFEHEKQAKEQILRCSTVHDNLVLLNLRDEETIFASNRFVIYALFPQCNVSIHEMWGREKQNIVFATGKSILDRSCKTNVGELMLGYGGGGHQAAGTCQIATSQAGIVREELIAQLQADEMALAPIDA